MIWCVTLNPALDVTYPMEQPLALGAVNLAAGMDARLGGKGNNVARVAKRLDAAVTVVSLWGGFVGMELDRRACALGLATLSVATHEDSRVCLTLLSANGTVTELRPPGPLVQRAEVDRLLGMLQERVQPDDWVTLSGSLPRGLTPDTYAQWVEALRGRVAGIAVDASGRALELALAAGPTLATPNQTEYATLQKKDGWPTTHLLVTQGSHGVMWSKPDGSQSVWSAPQVRVVNPVGAGDTFLGALVSRLVDQAPIDKALPYAVAAASASVETLGVADFDPARAQELTKEVVRQ